MHLTVLSLIILEYSIPVHFQSCVLSFAFSFSAEKQPFSFHGKSAFLLVRISFALIGAETDLKSSEVTEILITLLA